MFTFEPELVGYPFLLIQTDTVIMLTPSQSNILSLLRLWKLESIIL